jgi:polar amino acid transport system substrate-binding protein
MKILVLLLITLGLSNASFAAESSAKTYKFIGQEYEPFNWTEGSKPTGGMVDVVLAACKRMKINCDIDMYPMKRAIEMLQEGTAVGMLSLVKNPDRESYATLSDPIIMSNMSFFAVKGTFSKITKIEDMKGATVGAVSSSSAAKIADKFKDQVKEATIVYETGLPILINKLSAGRYGAKGLVVSNADVFHHLAKRERVTNVEPVFVAETNGFGVAFSKKATDQAFIDKFNKAISEMKKSGQIKKLLKRYDLKSE